ncbi:PD-(D/E)XK motif protein [Pseudarthrobacter sp. RMG13]|uniref:PD-(D/E)XK motif protein n=1 Tax=Pseudarthrobacter humi TaxID=2952523 RepID=A0ABT1LPG3_9MICC|nr:PD-(D/E)XK motif protein [Pseudarthrobacter humi]MCP9000347.1 PD-(D/E)XK motif protein [Pseudarthrobacter humi]
MSNPVEAAWLSAIETKLPRTFEIDPNLELRLVCGTDQAGQPMFCSISSLKPGIPELSDAVDVTRTQRTIDGNWVLLLTLRTPKFTDVFVQLCAHIVDCVSETSSESQGLSAFIASVEDWRTLLQAGPSQRLSLEATRGLFGELWVGFWKLVPTYSIPHVMEAWRGPFKSDQDFQFPGGPLIEVKTVHSRARRIQISSENQLHRLATEHLYLCVVSADDALAETPGAMTVPELLDETERLLEGAGVPRFELTSRLAELRFDRSDDIYADMHFLATGVRYLEVRDSFPRIEPSMLPDGVSRVSYALDLADLASYECEFPQLELIEIPGKASFNES